MGLSRVLLLFYYPIDRLTGDCFVDFEDFALMANQWSIEYDWEDLAVMASEWLVEGVPEDPNSLVWVYIDDPGVSGHEGFTGYMSKYETTNAQYCQFLNAALASGDITVSGSTVTVVHGANGSPLRAVLQKRPSQSAPLWRKWPESLHYGNFGIIGL